jgi:hypothetical protein
MLTPTLRPTAILSDRNSGSGTKLPSNLFVHNVPKYKNPKELKKLLQDRLEALGRKAA